MAGMRRILQVYIVNLHSTGALSLFLIFDVFILFLVGGLFDYSVVLVEGALFRLGWALWFYYSIFFLILGIIVEVCILRVGRDRAAILTFFFLFIFFLLVLTLAVLVRVQTAAARRGIFRCLVEVSALYTLLQLRPLHRVERLRRSPCSLGSIIFRCNEAVRWRLLVFHH